MHAYIVVAHTFNNSLGAQTAHAILANMEALRGPHAQAAVGNNISKSTTDLPRGDHTL
jgi:hypothetical protein